MKKRWMLISGLLTLVIGILAGVIWRVAARNLLQSKPPLVIAAHHTAEPITVDGVLDEPDWANAKTISFIIPESLKEPISKTEAKIVYDKNFLYVAFKAYDRDIWGVLTNRDSATCGEDVIEIFFKTHPDKDPYFDFEINALGTVYDAYVGKRGGAGGDARWSRWNCNGLKIAAKIKGTLDDFTDDDEYWILEVAIPFAEIPALGGKPPVKGDVWLFSLARYDYSVYLSTKNEGKFGLELSSISPLSRIDFQWYEDWRELIFN